MTDELEPMKTLIRHLGTAVDRLNEPSAASRFRRLRETRSATLDHPPR